MFRALLSSGIDTAATLTDTEPMNGKRGWEEAQQVESLVCEHPSLCSLPRTHISGHGAHFSTVRRKQRAPGP